MANKIKIDAVVDDHGTMKKTTLEAKKLGGGLDKVAKNSRTVDRGLKGASKQSSNSTKNFSKMAQGISGGLIPAYAVLAANIFAVSAAFQFLKSAGTLKTLQEGQTSYAAATGIALNSLTQDIIAATDAQINFQDASQAAAIGIASGLNADQLVRLGKAAKDASLILGRDVPDSFNRLVRGVTKAEPELLDELGIILRLEDAKKAYGLIINKNAKDLTAFERSQAVANDVLTQSEEKYSRILAITSPATNSFVKMGKAFDDIINKIKIISSTMLGPLADAVTTTPTLGIAIMGLFAKSILGTILNTEAWGASSVTASRNAQAGYLRAERALARLTRGQTAAVASAAILQSTGGLPSTFKGKGFQQVMAGKGASLSSQQIVGMRSAVNASKVMAPEMKAIWVRELNIMLAESKRTTAGMTANLQVVATSGQLAAAKIKIAFVGAFAAMRAAAAGFVKYASIALNVAGWVAIAALAIGMVVSFFKVGEEAETMGDKVGVVTDKMANLNEEFKDFNAVQQVITEDGAGLLGYYTALGNRIGQVGVAMNKTALSFAGEAFGGAAKGLGFGAKASNLFSNMTSMLANALPGVSGARIGSAAAFDPSFGGFLASSGDKRLEDLGEYYRNLAQEQETSNIFAEGGSKAMNSYLETIVALLDAEGPNEVEALTTALAQQHPAIAALTSDMKELVRIRVDNQAAADGLLQSYMQESQQIRVVNTLMQEKALMDSIAADASASLNEAEQARLKVLEYQIDLFQKMDRLEKDKATRARGLKLSGVMGDIGTTKGQSALIAFEQQRIGLTNRRLYAEEKIDIILKSKATNEQKENQILLLNDELDLINAQTEALERKASMYYQVADSAKQALETGLTRGIGELIKGDEASLKDAIRTIAVSVLEATAETLASQITDILMKQGAISVAYQQAQIISGSFLAAGSVVATQLYNAMLGVPVTTSAVSASSGSVAATATGRSGGLMQILGTAAMAIPGLLGFANGGIVNGPTSGYPIITHGKEAVVPLGNGNSIPVDLKGAGTKIEINIDASGTSASGSGDMEQLGKAIAGAVQRELQTQKRAGGILNPYGAA